MPLELQSQPKATMTKELYIHALRKGSNGSEILRILDVLCDGSDTCESGETVCPTLDTIEF